MKTTIDIPEDEIREAMTFLGAKSKKQVVLAALFDFNKKHRMARLTRFSGTCSFSSNDAIERLENAELKKGT